MHLLKCARRTDESVMGDLVLCFEKQANRQSAKETVLEYSSEFWLNKYFEIELLLDEHCADALAGILSLNCAFFLKSPKVESFDMRYYFGHDLPSSDSLLFPSCLKRKPGEFYRQIRTCCTVACLLPQKPNTTVDEW
jgi:hypothetical protein